MPPPHSAVEPPSPAPPVVAEVEVPRSVAAFDENVIEGKLKPFVDLTKSFAAASVVEQVGVELYEMVNDDRGLIPYRFHLWKLNSMTFAR